MTNQPAIGSKVRFSFTIPVLDDIRREGVGIVRFHDVVGTCQACGIEVIESGHYQVGERPLIRTANLQPA